MSAGPNGPCPYPGEPSVTVTDHPCPPSWNNATMLYEQVKKMPGPPSWKSDIITLKEAPTEPQTLYWQDLVESTHFLFQNPEFDGNMAYVPSCLYQQDDTQVYSEMTMGEEWHYQQVCPSPNLLKSHNMIQFIKAHLANGTTILGIILVSDHTHLTNFTGDKKMHAVYLSIGNISKDIHQKHNSHAWLLVTKIPISKFSKTQFSGPKTKQEAMPGILSHHLFHECMR